MGTNTTVEIPLINCIVKPMLQMKGWLCPLRPKTESQHAHFASTDVECDVIFSRLPHVTLLNSHSKARNATDALSYTSNGIMGLHGIGNVWVGSTEPPLQQPDTSIKTVNSG
jgi:hypothetical protein